MARRRFAVSAIPDDGTSVDQWSVVAQCVRRVKPQIAQVATPVVGSTSRKLGQPLVPQKRREPLVAAEVRRRMRRMELARPAKVVVVERDIMVSILVLLSGAPQAVRAWAAADDRFFRSGQPEMGAGTVW
jgi:hypothetical protein